jgi:adenylosuccinate lyase
MIDRYTRPQMGRVWSEQNKLDKWLRVELAVIVDIFSPPREEYR